MAEKTEGIVVGEIYTGKVLKIKPFGAIISLPGNSPGLVHISQIANGFVQNVGDVLQESGYVVRIDRMLAIFNRPDYLSFKTSISEYCLYFSGTIIGGSPRISHETDEVGFFDIDNLPELSFKNSKEELTIALDVYFNKKETYFD